MPTPGHKCRRLFSRFILMWAVQGTPQLETLVAVTIYTLPVWHLPLCYFLSLYTIKHWCSPGLNSLPFCLVDAYWAKAKWISTPTLKFLTISYTIPFDSDLQSSVFTCLLHIFVPEHFHLTLPQRRQYFYHQATYAPYTEWRCQIWKSLFGGLTPTETKPWLFLLANFITSTPFSPFLQPWLWSKTSSSWP